MPRCLIFLLIIITSMPSMSQNQNKYEDFFKDISIHTKGADAKDLLIHMIDGLGFRFYWATEGLRPEDYDYKISDDSRTCGETIAHINDLSIMILAACKGINKNDLELVASDTDLDPETNKNDILKLLYEAREYLYANTVDIKDIQIVLSRPEGESIFPVWNLIHGPISDALWHTGQIASFRRASGNPISTKMSHFLGKVR